MDITFPGQNPVVTQQDTVAFQAIVDGRPETCQISFEALQDHFGASTNQPADLIRAFISGKEEIHAVARRKRPHSAGRWLIVSADFGTQN